MFSFLICSSRTMRDRRLKRLYATPLTLGRHKPPSVTPLRRVSDAMVIMSQNHSVARIKNIIKNRLNTQIMHLPSNALSTKNETFCRFQFYITQIQSFECSGFRAVFLQERTCHPSY